MLSMHDFISDQLNVQMFETTNLQMQMSRCLLIIFQKK